MQMYVTTLVTFRHSLVERTIATILDISEDDVHTIVVKKLCISHIRTKLVPYLLTNEMKDEHVQICLYWRNKLAEEET